MRVYKIVVIIVFCLIQVILPNQIHAHSSYISFFKMFQQDSSWHLTVTLSQSTVVHHLKNIYEKKNNQKPSNDYLEKQLIEYLKSHIYISLNKKPTVLKLENIRLGNHETKVSFTLSNHTKTINNLSVTIDAFSNGKNHHNVLLITSNSIKKKIILSAKNNYSSGF